MSVDKFGRHSGKQKVCRGPKGDGFRLTKDGDYDIGGKRMTNVGSPTKPEDAVTKVYVDRGRPIKDKTFYKFNKYRVHDIGAPKHETDAVTLKYMKERIPVIQNDKWLFSNRRLSGVKRPLEDSDAVTKSYLEEHTPKSEDTAWNCKKKRLHMVASPETLSDAVNVTYFGERLGQALHTMYLQLAPSTDPVHTMPKEAWTRTRVFEPLFGGPITKSLAGVL